MGLCSVRMPLLECVADDGAVRCAGSAFGHKCYSPEPDDPINGAVPVRDQQRGAWPEFSRSSPRDRLDSTRLKPRKVCASGGRGGDKIRPIASGTTARVPVIAVLNIAFLQQRIS